MHLFDLVVASSVTLPEQLDKAAAIPNEPKHQQREAAQKFSRQVLDVAAVFQLSVAPVDQESTRKRGDAVVLSWTGAPSDRTMKHTCAW